MEQCARCKCNAQFIRFGFSRRAMYRHSDFLKNFEIFFTLSTTLLSANLDKFKFFATTTMMM